MVRRVGTAWTRRALAGLLVACVVGGGSVGAGAETVTYTLISGSADVTRAADGQPGTTPETVTGPTTVKLRTGAAVVENPALVDEAANKGEGAGRDPAVVATDAGAPLYEPVE